MLTIIRRLLRDLWLHLGPGMLCILRRRHRDLVNVGEYRRKSFRPVPLFQCRKCFSFYIVEHDAKRVGGKHA